MHSTLEELARGCCNEVDLESGVVGCARGREDGARSRGRLQLTRGDEEQRASETPELSALRIVGW